jgi:hypothetical protein
MINKELSKISSSIFSEMRGGKHFSANDGEDFFLIEKYETELRDIFSAVGFELVIDQLGFAYINGEKDNLINKKTIQKEAAFFFVLIQWLLEEGKNPVQCIKEQQMYSLNGLPHLSSGSNQDIMRAVEITNDSELASILKGLNKRGFIILSTDYFTLLSPSFRYVNLCYKVESSNGGEEE